MSRAESDGEPMEALAYAVLSAWVLFVTMDPICWTCCTGVWCGCDWSITGRDHKRLWGCFGACSSSCPIEFLIEAPVLSSVMIAPCEHISRAEWRGFLICVGRNMWAVIGITATMYCRVQVSPLGCMTVIMDFPVGGLSKFVWKALISAPVSRIAVVLMLEILARCGWDSGSVLAVSRW